MNEGIGNTFVSSRGASTKKGILSSSRLSNGQRNRRWPLRQQIRSGAMPRVEATMRSDKHIPFSITGHGTDHVSPVRDVAACELNLSGFQSVVGCVCSLGAAKVLWWALWLFEPQCSTLQASPIPRSDCFCSAPLFLSPRRFKLKAGGKGNSRCN